MSASPEQTFAAAMPPAAGVAVLGEALVDIFPDRTVLGGAPFNVARNLAALGCTPNLFTRIGQDVLGDGIQAECRRFGIPLDHVQRDAHHPTGAVRVHMQGQQHQFEILPDRAWDRLDAQQAVEGVQQAAPRWVYFGTLAQRSRASRQAIREAVNATWAQTFLDLNLRPGADDQELVAASLMLADVVKVNDEELERLLAWFNPGLAGDFGSQAHQAQVAGVMRRFDLQRLFVTRGAGGHALFERELGLTQQGQASRVAVQDTVGAGDAFSAVLLLGGLRQWPLPLTLSRASAFATAVCALPGAVSADLGWYDPWRDAWQEGAVASTSTATSIAGA